MVLLGIELMLNAANLNFIAFWRYGPATNQGEGVLFVVFSIAVAAAEAAVGLALVISIYRHQKNIRHPQLTTSLSSQWPPLSPRFWETVQNISVTKI